MNILHPVLGAKSKVNQIYGRPTVNLKSNDALSEMECCIQLLGEFIIRQSYGHKILSLVGLRNVNAHTVSHPNPPASCMRYQSELLGEQGHHSLSSLSTANSQKEGIVSGLELRPSVCEASL